MRYRPLSPTGDYTIGQPYLTNIPAAVAQAILTRLKLWRGEWFLDTSDGTPYLTQILGERPGKNPDAAIKARITQTTGVTLLTAYSSKFDGNTRTFTVTATVQSQYSTTPITITSTLQV